MTEELKNLLLAAGGGDKKAEEQILLQNTGLIWSVARRFFGRGTEPDDLFQLGALGFIKAVRGFREDFGTEFSTYAVPKIAGEIRRFLRDDGPVKVSRTIKERSAAIKSIRQKMNLEHGIEPTVSELADILGLSAEEIAEAEAGDVSVLSIHKSSGDEGFCLEAILSSDFTEDSIVEHVSLRDALDALPQREREVISLRYFHGLTQENTARIIGVSQVQISRLERKALIKLREYF